MSQISENSKNFKHFRKKLEQLATDTDAAAMNVASRMADVGLNITKKNTPVGQYKDGRQGGTARKGWIKTPTYKTAKAFVSGYSNNVYYVIYVNNGHRIVSKTGVTVGYVKGVRMLEQGMDEARRQTQTLFNEEVAKLKRKGGW